MRSRTVFENGVVVSTINLPFNHGYKPDKELWYETMVFPSEGNFRDIYRKRYTTKEEAEEGHIQICSKVSRGIIKVKGEEDKEK